MKKIYLVEINYEYSPTEEECDHIFWLNEKGGGVFSTLAEAYEQLVAWYNYAWRRGVVAHLIDNSKNTITMDLVEFEVPNNFNIKKTYCESDSYLYECDYQHEVIDCLYLCGSYEL